MEEYAPYIIIVKVYVRDGEDPLIPVLKEAGDKEADAVICLSGLYYPIWSSHP